MMKEMLLLCYLISNLIGCLSGLNLTYYPVVIESTNASNISSFDMCVCQCLTSSDCRYFGYWSSSSSPTCQIYNSSEDKPDIISYILTNNDNRTGLYNILSSNSTCYSSLSNSSYNSTHTSSSHVSLTPSRIINVLIMSIDNHSRLVVIDSNNFSYYTFQLNPFQIIDNDTFTPGGCIPLCARQFSNLLYIGCTMNLIEVRQFTYSSSTSNFKPELSHSYSTSGGGAPECFTILNENIIYYVIGTGHVYALFTQTNISKQLYSFSDVTFASPSVVITLDSINMALFFASRNGTLFRLQLSLMNIDNGTSNISVGLLDRYEMPVYIRTSIFIDKCNRLWAFSSEGSFKPQMILFIQQENSNKTFSTMSVMNYTNSLPVFNSTPYNFELDDNYSLFTAKCSKWN